MVVLVVHCTTEGGTVQIVVGVNDIKELCSIQFGMATYGHMSGPQVCLILD